MITRSQVLASACARLIGNRALLRIEDDLIVTETGNEVIFDALPIDASGLESWMAAKR